MTDHPPDSPAPQVPYSPEETVRLLAQYDEHYAKLYTGGAPGAPTKEELIAELDAVLKQLRRSRLGIPSRLRRGRGGAARAD
jgi:hypothetical protein